MIPVCNETQRLEIMKLIIKINTNYTQNIVLTLKITSMVMMQPFKVMFKKFNKICVLG